MKAKHQREWLQMKINWWNTRCATRLGSIKTR